MKITPNEHTSKAMFPTQQQTFDSGLRPPPAIRPSLMTRLSSGRLYALDRRDPSDIEVGLGPDPVQAPADGVNQTRRHYPQNTPSERSFSSGPTLCETDPSDNANGQDTDSQHSKDTTIQQAEQRMNTVKSEPEKSMTSTVTLHSDFDDYIATKEGLEKMLEEYPMPGLEGLQRWNKLRYGFFSVYHRLFAIALLANIAALCVRISQVVLHPGSFTYADAATAVAINLFVGSMVRHEHAINLFFRVCTSLPHWVPLAIRRHAAKVYSHGGVHSACGISAFGWYIFFSVLLVRQWQGNEAIGKAVTALSGIMLLDLIFLTGMSYPKIRTKFHNQWEWTHCFGGWLAILVVWAQIALLVYETSISQHRSYGRCLISTPAFWFLVAITLMIFYPWIRLRRRRVEAEKLSDHAMRLTFPGHKRRMTTCAGVRLSTSPLLENHGFATIPEPNGEKAYSMIVSNAGDWTRKIIENPPKYLYTRGAPTLGVARVALLFKRIVFVATGSGIGPALSFLQVHPEWDCRVLWSGRYPEQTFGPKIISSVLAADPKAVIIDGKKTGRPKLAELTYSLVREIDAEAVICISNPGLTNEVVYSMEVRKIPAYGAIWDS